MRCKVKEANLLRQLLRVDEGNARRGGGDGKGAECTKGGWLVSKW